MLLYRNIIVNLLWKSSSNWALKFDLEIAVLQEIHLVSDMSVGRATQMWWIFNIYFDIDRYHFTPANTRLVEPGSPVLQRLLTQTIFSPLMQGPTRSSPAIAPSDNQFSVTVPGNWMRAEALSCIPSITFDNAQVAQSSRKQSIWNNSGWDKRTAEFWMGQWDSRR